MRILVMFDIEIYFRKIYMYEIIVLDIILMYVVKKIFFFLFYVY